MDEVEHIAQISDKGHESDNESDSTMEDNIKKEEQPTRMSSRSTRKRASVPAGGSGVASRETKKRAGGGSKTGVSDSTQPKKVSCGWYLSSAFSFFLLFFFLKCYHSPTFLYSPLFPSQGRQCQGRQCREIMVVTRCTRRN